MHPPGAGPRVSRFASATSVGRVRRVGAALAMLAGAVWIASGARAQRAPAPELLEEVQRLEAETAYLQRRVDLATSDAFYLLLDPEAPDLALMLGGAVLQRHAVTAIEIGTPRIAFFDVGTPPAWRGISRTDGTLAPGRPVEERRLEPPAPGTEEEVSPADAVPPTAEEAIRVPSRYWLRFDDGVALEIVRDPGGSGRWRDVLAALSASKRDKVRVRVTLSADAADSLYRSLPPSTGLLVTLEPFFSGPLAR